MYEKGSEYPQHLADDELVHAHATGSGHTGEGQMRLFRSMYPKLALVAVLVSLAIASGAAKKWT